MKIINGFMLGILKMQRLVLTVELFIEMYRKIIVRIIQALFFIVLPIMAWLKLYNVVFYLAIFIIFFIYTMFTIGWCVSVRQFVKVVFLINIFYITVFLGIGLAILKLNDISEMLLIKIALILYFILWFLLSLIAKSEVAKLVNEVISAMLTILFTAGTYIIGVKSSTYPSLDIIAKTYRNIDEFEKVISQNSQVGWDIFTSCLLWLLQKAFLIVLPFLCLSIFNIVAISVKKYWLEKHGIDDLWEQLEKQNAIVNKADNHV